MRSSSTTSLRSALFKSFTLGEFWINSTWSTYHSKIGCHISYICCHITHLQSGEAIKFFKDTIWQCHKCVGKMILHNQPWKWKVRGSISRPTIQVEVLYGLHISTGGERRDEHFGRKLHSNSYHSQLCWIQSYSAGRPILQYYCEGVDHFTPSISIRSIIRGGI